MPEIANISVSPHGITSIFEDEQWFIPISMVSGVVCREKRKALNIYAVNPEMSMFIRNHPDINKIHRDLLRVLGGKI